MSRMSIRNTAGGWAVLSGDRLVAEGSVVAETPTVVTDRPFFYAGGQTQIKTLLRFRIPVRALYMGGCVFVSCIAGAVLESVMDRRRSQ